VRPRPSAGNRNRWSRSAGSRRVQVSIEIGLKRPPRCRGARYLAQSRVRAIVPPQQTLHARLMVFSVYRTLRVRIELARAHVLDHALAQRVMASVLMGTLLSEVDDTSILRKRPTGQHHCSFKCSLRSQKSRPPQRAIAAATIFPPAWGRVRGQRQRLNADLGTISDFLLFSIP
jgi:hypothetical protein